MNSTFHMCASLFVHLRKAWILGVVSFNHITHLSSQLGGPHPLAGVGLISAQQDSMLAPSLPLLALPAGGEETPVACNSVVKLHRALFETVLDCSLDNDPMGLLAMLNKKVSPVKFYQMDFKPSCVDNQIQLILYEDASWLLNWKPGAWDPIVVDVTSGEGSLTLLLRFKSSNFFAKGKLVNNVTMDIPYTSLVFASNSQPK